MVKNDEKFVDNTDVGPLISGTSFLVKMAFWGTMSQFSVLCTGLRNTTQKNDNWQVRTEHYQDELRRGIW